MQLTQEAEPYLLDFYRAGDWHSDRGFLSGVCGATCAGQQYFSAADQIDCRAAAVWHSDLRNFVRGRIEDHGPHCAEGYHLF